MNPFEREFEFSKINLHNYVNVADVILYYTVEDRFPKHTPPTHSPDLKFSPYVLVKIFQFWHWKDRQSYLQSIMLHLSLPPNLLQLFRRPQNHGHSVERNDQMTKICDPNRVSIL
uniref:Uncharacterized protein n=1 Tax=Glossina brevipalpis TaxID=37001 RepID=A0A1A9WUE7_9MUSC